MINKLILDALDNYLPTFYITKNEYKGSCIVFNYIETPAKFSDNREDIVAYDVLLNLYDRENIKQSSKEIINRLIEKGFKKTVVQSALDCGDGLFNMPIKLKISIESRDL